MANTNTTSSVPTSRPLQPPGRALTRRPQARRPSDVDIKPGDDQRFVSVPRVREAIHVQRVETGSSPADTVIEIAKPTLNQLYQDEKTHWSRRYADLTDTRFKEQIDAYHQARTDLFADIASGKKVDIPARSRQLGTQLTMAFGLIDTDGNWDPEIARRIRAGGADYAHWSIKANDLVQAPGILRSAASLTTTAVAASLGGMAAVPATQIAMAAINGLYVPLSMIAFARVPILQARGQSIDVALRAHHGPPIQPDVSASKLVKEDGTIGTLRGTEFLNKRIAKLEQLKRSDSQRNLELEIRRLDLQILKTKYRIDKHKIENELAVVDPLQSGSAPEDRATARRYLELKQLATKLATQDEEHVLYDNLLRAGDGSPASNGGLNPETIKAIDLKLDELRLQLDIEEIFVQLSHQKYQGSSKNTRNVWNFESAFFGASAAIASLVGNTHPIMSPALNGFSLASQIAQVVTYHLTHEKGAANDYGSLLTTMCQVCALTGVGNLAPKGRFDATRLDAMFVGPMRRRITHFKNILEFDRSVYLAAILTALADANGNMPQGSYQYSEAFFKLLSDKKGPEGRQAYVQAALQNLKVDRDRAEAMVMPILALYEKNEENIAHLTAGRLEELLGDDEALPAETRRIFEGALKHAAGEDGFSQHDDELAKLKGLTESLSDLGSVNQAAQKVGQTFAKFVAGPATPVAVKTLASLTQIWLYAPMSDGFSFEVRKKVIDAINLGGNVVSMAGSLVALGIAYAAYENIATKEVHRQRDRDRGAAMPNAGISSWGWFGEKKGTPTSFSTLAAKQIELGPVPLRYDLQASFRSDVLEQVMAPSFQKLLTYWKLEPAKFDVSSIKTTDQAIQILRKESQNLEEILKKEGVRPERSGEIDGESELLEIIVDDVEGEASVLESESSAELQDLVGKLPSRANFDDAEGYAEAVFRDLIAYDFGDDELDDFVQKVNSRSTLAPETLAAFSMTPSPSANNLAAPRSPRTPRTPRTPRFPGSLPGKQRSQVEVKPSRSGNNLPAQPSQKTLRKPEKEADKYLAASVLNDLGADLAPVDVDLGTPIEDWQLLNRIIGRVFPGGIRYAKSDPDLSGLTDSELVRAQALALKLHHHLEDQGDGSNMPAQLLDALIDEQSHRPKPTEE